VGKTNTRFLWSLGSLGLEKACPVHLVLCMFQRLKTGVMEVAKFKGLIPKPQST